MMKLLVTAFLLQVVCLVPGACYGQEKIGSGTGDASIRNFAVCTCLAESYKGSSLEDDALKAAGGYFEKSNYGADLFMAVQIVAAKWAKEKKYQSKHGANLSLMKCLDLYGSQELTDLIERLR